ncbi:MAG: gamma-glutamylcyclotransferase [Gemmatimonadota bacterium]|uniref:gamma-glutamylcyclotransferase family protein n=1 Tax=Candidatus Palauibacter scopulicola TaxID=3056741 RepID=UPI0023A5116E|nr:gamma-glutamylcyclotransferase family protein [Candidatus Palauibacter scopulicola]MDE2663434.1 gamma-glutamylcyclotransferase [Candidatus Palauibacter scopulicola]
MTADGPAPGPIRDPAPLRGALSRLNDARLAPEHSSARLAALLAGFEELAAVLPGEDRRPGAAGALAELEALLSEPGAETGAAALREYLEPILERLIEALLDHPERRLAVYGSLLPGENNHHHVATLVGRWVEGTVEGTLHDRGWAARQGYPGFVHGGSGDRVAVKVLESPGLTDAWDRLDAFEGEAYRRILAPVEMKRLGTGAEGETGWRVCNIYELTDRARAARAPDRERDPA